MNGVPAWLTPRRTAIAAAAAVGALYMAALPGPLRLDVDSAWLLRLGASLSDGTGLHPPDSQSFPPGYPVLVAALDRAGVAGPSGLMLLGIMMLAVGVAAAWYALRLDLRLTATEATVVALLTLVSVYSIKYAMLPLTETPFLAVSALSVAAFAVARRRGGSPAWIVAGAVLAGAACTIRTAGIALALALALTFPSARARLVALVLGGAGVVAAIAVAPYYLESLIDHWREEPLLAAWQEPYWLIRSSGSVVGQVPNSAWDNHLLEPLTVVAGLTVLGVTGWALWSRRRDLGPVDGWVAGTIVIVFLFPTEHSRFFLPVLPFLLGYCALAARHVPRLALAGAATFAAIGLVALAYSTALSYTGLRFPERYAGGALAPTYRVAWGLARPGDVETADEHIVWALRRFDPDPPAP